MKLLTTISENYVADWGLFEGIRELVQNGLDARDKGFRFDIIYRREQEELLIYNDGTSITRANLLLGNTSKRGDENQRGQHGEGFKIGILALIRCGKKVEISNGINSEVIHSSIEQHPDYGNTRVLCFETEQSNILPIDKNKLIFKVCGITAQEVNSIKDKFLEWEGLQLGDYYKTSVGKVLLQPRYKGKIFSRGIYVCDIPKFEYGYDFETLSLGRDRNLARQTDMEWETSKIWSKLGETHGKDELVINMLKSDAPDVRDIDYFTKEKLNKKCHEKFFSDNGDKSYPCSSEYQKKEIASLGLKPIIVSETHRKVLEHNFPSLYSIREKQKLAKADHVDMTKVFSDLFAEGWKIKYYPCDCGGKYTWLYPDDDGNYHNHGCICHKTPIDKGEDDSNS
jgi:hypothetical protein